MKSNLLAQMSQEAITNPMRVEPYSKRPKAPTPESRIVERANDSKVRATADWVDGHIDSKKHDAIHKRADSVLKNKGYKRAK